MKVDEEAEDMASEKECDHCLGVSWCIAIKGEWMVGVHTPLEDG